MHRYWVYIVGNKSATAIYIGVTNNIQRRIAEHKLGTIPGYTQRYRCNRLLYFEEHQNVKHAIAREKAIKRLSRHRKELLIAQINPYWRELVE